MNRPAKSAIKSLVLTLRHKLEDDIAIQLKRYGFAYLHMAQGNYRDYLKGPTVWIKKYFYVLRPILAINWIERGMGVVPTEFQVLVEQVVDTPELKEEIGKLIEARRRGEELDRGPRIVPISEFIESELARLENKQFEQEYDKPVAPVDEFNELLRSALDEVWSSSGL